MNKTCGKCEQDKELSCFYKQQSAKDGTASICKPCRKENDRKYYKKNKEKYNRKAQEYYLKNKEQIKNRVSEYQKDNKEDIKSYKKSYRKRNRERLNRQDKEYYQANQERRKKKSADWYTDNKDYAKRRFATYRDNNSAKFIAISAKYRAAKLQRIPAWLTADDYKWMEWYYKQAQRLTELTGVPHHVDHVIPMQGKTVSGLHTPYNLQILTAAENMSKGNKWEGING